MTPVEFFAALTPAAQQLNKTTGIPASFTLAQAALESAWGESGLAKRANNLFGVKADRSWTGDVLILPTKEFRNGQWVTEQARWRKFHDWQASIEDHARFLQQNHRYASAFLCKDGEGFARAVAAAGYATDPQYAYKLVSIIRKHGLSNLDAGDDE